MRCLSARRMIEKIGEREAGKVDPKLAAHLDKCPVCAEEMGLHLRLLSELSAAMPLPAFRDLAPLVMASLEEVQVQRRMPAWQVACAATAAASLLALGYFLGSQSSAPQSRGSMEETYQEALSISPGGQPELAYGYPAAPVTVAGGER